MTDRQRTISLASDDRGRVPFAMIGVLVLLSSTAIIGVLETRPESSTDANLDLQRALDQMNATAQETLRAAVREAAKQAAAEPVTKALSSTPAGSAIEPSSGGNEYAIDNATFERYAKLRIYLEARRKLDGAVQRVNGNVEGTISIPPVEYTASNLSEAIGRVRLTPGSERSGGLEPGKLRVRIEGIKMTVTREGSTITTKSRPITVTVASTTFAQHYKTIRYEKRLNKGFLSSSGLNGFSRKFAARIYPLAYAKAYYERISAPHAFRAKAFKSVLENYELETLANDAIFNVQRNVFGTVDPGASDAMAGAWVCSGIKTGIKLASGSTKSKYQSKLNTLCQATRFIFGGPNGNKLNSVSDITSKYINRNTGRNLKKAQQIINKKKKIHVKQFANPANQEMRGGQYDWNAKDKDWEEEAQSDTVPNKDKLGISVDFPSNWGDKRLNDVINDVYTTSLSAAKGSTTKTGSFPSVDSPGSKWSVYDSSTTVKSQSTTVDHTGTASSGNPRRLHRFDITVTRTIEKTKEYEWYEDVPCGKHERPPCTERHTTSESDTSTVTFETSITLSGDHTVGTDIRQKGVSAAYQQNGAPKPAGWSNSKNYRKAKRASIRQLLAVGPGSPVSALESNIDPGAVDSRSAFNSEVTSQITSNSGSVNTLTQSRSDLKQWLKKDLTRTHELVIGQRTGLNWDPEIEVSRVELATDTNVFSKLKKRLQNKEQRVIYRGIGGSYANAPARAKVQLRERYLDRVYHWIDTVEKKRNEARGAANKNIKDKFSKNLGKGVSVINEGLSFVQNHLDGSGAPSNPGRAKLKHTPLTGDITYQVNGSPTYLTSKPVTRDTVPSVRPKGETISDPENTLYSSFVARNHMFLPRPGLPLVPWPTFWYLSVNNVNVKVKGEYARFEVTATSGSPTSSGATPYIRQAQPVSLVINGIQRQVGKVESIDFQNLTPVVLMTPGGTVMAKGSLGPGDIAGSKRKHSLRECTKNWKYVGADFDPRTDVTASDCANIRSGGGGLSTFKAFVPNEHKGKVQTIGNYLDDDNYGGLCHLSGSAGLALAGGVRSSVATAAADDDEDTAGCADGELSINFINVGKGTAIFVNGTDGQSMLIDAGSRKHPDKYGKHPGERVEDVIHNELENVGDAPYKVDYLVVTHNHDDHVNFIDRIDDVEFGTVYHQGELDGDGLPKEPDSYESKETLQTDEGGKIDLGSDTIQVAVHHPVDGLWEDLRDNPCGTVGRSGQIKDCNSIVMSLEWGETKFVFPSDIRANTKRHLWDGAGPFGGADVIQVAHHGSKTSLIKDEPIYCRTPSLESAVISNVKQGPDAAVLQALDDAGLATYWTGVHGNVEYVVTDGGHNLWLTPESKDGDARQTVHSADAGDLTGMAAGSTSADDLCAVDASDE